MNVVLKSKWVEPVLWVLSVGFLLWHVFICVVVLDLTGVIPMALVSCVIFLLRLRHEYLTMAIQLWALYLVMSSGLKLLASYMQSIGALTYDWSTISLYRNVFFVFVAAVLYYISWKEIDVIRE